MKVRRLDLRFKNCTLAENTIRTCPISRDASKDDGPRCEVPNVDARGKLRLQRSFFRRRRRLAEKRGEAAREKNRREKLPFHRTELCHIFADGAPGGRGEEGKS